MKKKPRLADVVMSFDWFVPNPRLKGYLYSMDGPGVGTLTACVDVVTCTNIPLGDREVSAMGIRHGGEARLFRNMAWHNEDMCGFCRWAGQVLTTFTRISETLLDSHPCDSSEEGIVCFLARDEALHTAYKSTEWEGPCAAFSIGSATHAEFRNRLLHELTSIGRK